MFKTLIGRSLVLSARRACCSSALQSTTGERFDWKWRRRSNRSWRWSKWGAAAPLLGFSFLTTAKDLLGIKPFILDDNPTKDRVKKAWLARKHGKFDEALQLLNEALQLAMQQNEQLPISRVYDELANTYYEMGNLDEAEKHFRLLIHRLMDLHNKRESAPEFIEISLKLSDIFAQKGNLDNAETGYMHCVTKQMKVVDEHLRKYLVSHGALVEGAHPVENHGSVFTDPIALFGMCLEQFAQFLVKYRDESRLEESQEYINEALKISHQLFGSVSYHMVNLLNNYGALLIFANRFEIARKYLGLGIDKIIQVDECAPLIPGYYCNYAEALFHCGEIEEALNYARRAVQLSRNGDERMRNYAQKFLKDLEADAKRAKRGKR